MADDAIGDVQGCFDALQRLLCYIRFDESADRLWFVGDLVNRGAHSLAVLRFIKSLKQTPRITLGNHDLHLLNVLFGNNPCKNKDDTLDDVLSAPDAEELGHWLRKQPILYHDNELNTVMCHAGIAPVWNLAQASAYARELEDMLAADNFSDFLTHMYGNEPQRWTPTLTDLTRLRIICNYFTRMRFCDVQGNLNLSYKGTVEQAPVDLYPWFAVPNRIEIEPDIVFGHWAALKGKCPHPKIYALDTGCVWGRRLTALRLQDKRYFSVVG